MFIHNECETLKVRHLSRQTDSLAHSMARIRPTLPKPKIFLSAHIFMLGLPGVNVTVLSQSPNASLSQISCGKF